MKNIKKIEKVEYESPIVISTWQSMMDENRSKNLDNFDCAIFDECHTIKALEIKKIAQKCTNAHIRIGCTGTLPDDKLELWNIKSYLGPVLRDYNAAWLAERGYISKCNIHAINLKYNNKYIGEYNEIKDAVFQNTYRLDLIQKIISKLDGNALILVGKVEKEGQLLKSYMSLKNYTNKEVVFIYGKTKIQDREYWRKELENRKDVVLIATYPILQMGINIPSLKYIIFGAPFKSKIRILQSVGRSLRLHADKSHGAHVFDIIDVVKHLKDYGEKRYRYYVKEGFDVIEYNLVENEDLQNFLDNEKII